MVSEEPNYGTSATAILKLKDDVTYIRITDFDDFGLIEGQEIVTAEKYDSKHFLKDGDIVFARSGATVGKTYIHSESIGKAVFAGYCIRFRFDSEKVLPKFVFNYLKTRRYETWVKSIQRPSGQPNINKEEYKSFTIPLPPLPIQEKLVEEMERARESRRRKLRLADALLSTLDGWLLETLGITPPPEDNRKVFAVKFNKLSGRIDTQFYLPTFQKIQEAISKVRYSELGELVSYSSEMWDKQNADENDTFRYIEISGVNRNTGEAKAEDVLVSEAPSRARKLVREGDIIVSLTRPHHGSIAQIDSLLDNCVASTGFSVLRYFNEAKIIPSYLWAILRTKISLLQMQQRSSGGNYPAITEDELNKILIPLPDLSMQEMIAEEVYQRKENARLLKSEAESEWQAAKDWFEAQLLG